MNHLTLIQGLALGYTVLAILCVLRLWPWER